MQLPIPSPAFVPCHVGPASTSPEQATGGSPALMCLAEGADRSPSAVASKHRQLAGACSDLQPWPHEAPRRPLQPLLWRASRRSRRAALPADEPWEPADAPPDPSLWRPVPLPDLHLSTGLHRADELAGTGPRLPSSSASPSLSLLPFPCLISPSHHLSVSPSGVDRSPGMAPKLAAAGASPDASSTGNGTPSPRSMPPLRLLAVAAGICFPDSSETGSRCEDSFDYVPFIYFTDSFFFQAGSHAR